MTKTKFRLCDEVYTLFSREEEGKIHYEMWFKKKIIKYSCEQYTEPEIVIKQLGDLLLSSGIRIFKDELRKLISLSELKDYFEVL